MTTVDAEVLEVTTESVVAEFGDPPSAAESLVEAGLFGHDSHGVIRLLMYAQMIAD